VSESVAPPGEVHAGAHVSEHVEHVDPTNRKIDLAREQLDSSSLSVAERADAERRLTEAQQQADAAAARQGDSLLEGAWLRPAPPWEQPYYLGYSHEELKQMLAEQNEPSQVGQLSDAWISLGNTLVQFRDSIAIALAENESEWEGASAAAARASTGQIATWFGAAAQGAQLSGNRLAHQAELAQRARDSMPDPVAFSISDAQAGQLGETDPLAFARGMAIEERFGQQQDAHQAAAEVVEAYDAGLVESAATMPAFAAPPEFPRDAVNWPEARRDLPVAGGTTAAGATAGGWAPGPGASGDPGGSVAGHDKRATTGREVRAGLGASASSGRSPLSGQPVPLTGRGGPGQGLAPALAGRGRSEGDDDYEHDRAEYLVEPDPHDVWGTDQTTVKPVIGEQ